MDGENSPPGSEVVPGVPLPLDGRSVLPLVSLGGEVGEVVGSIEELGVLVVGGADGVGGGGICGGGGGVVVTVVDSCVLV